MARDDTLLEDLTEPDAITLLSDINANMKTLIQVTGGLVAAQSGSSSTSSSASSSGGLLLPGVEQVLQNTEQQLSSRTLGLGQEYSTLLHGVQQMIVKLSETRSVIEDNWEVASGSSKAIINVALVRPQGITPDLTGKASGFFTGTLVEFTSGKNVGVTRMISAASASAQLTLDDDLPNNPSRGDRFVVYRIGASSGSGGGGAQVLTSVRSLPITSTQQSTIMSYTPKQAFSAKVTVSMSVITAPTTVTLSASWTDPETGTETYTWESLANVPVGVRFELPILISAAANAPIEVQLTAGTANQVYVTGIIEDVS